MTKRDGEAFFKGAVILLGAMVAASWLETMSAPEPHLAREIVADLEPEDAPEPAAP